MDDELTRERMDELLRFLPLFAQPGRRFVKVWRGGERVDERTTTASYPEYEEDVDAFFRLLAQPWWVDHGYSPQVAGEMLVDDDRIARATLAEVRSVLTYCLRGERFGDGFWEGILKSGRVVALLKRLQELRERVV